ncbi:MAG: protein-methionine-sulfoxide reductase catalytic subunit MsrP, partial [Chloroflexales bacterium]
MHKIPASEITPEQLYLSRRAFLGAAGALSAAALLAACGGGTAAPAATPLPTDGRTDELGAPLSSFEQITTYNNYYEFTTDKAGVARLAQQFQTSPWAVQVGGLVGKPRTFSLEELLALAQEERIYRLRCVEGWSMVIPWRGFPLHKLLAAVEPQAGAKYVRFETLFRPEAMPGQHDQLYPWPYVEGLRLDEAMHDLTLLATGLYGRDLTPQNGGPVRLVVPWKYGFKSIKAFVKIDLVAEAPTSLWMALAPGEYGFYANVNPEVAHPRWSQASERRIGELPRRPTLRFNGYADQVAALYAGMDLRANY